MATKPLDSQPDHRGTFSPSWERTEATVYRRLRRGGAMAPIVDIDPISLGDVSEFKFIGTISGIDDTLRAVDEWRLFLDDAHRLASAAVARNAEEASVVYPRWLNVSSALSIIGVGAGAILMAWNTTVGAAVAGVGFIGIWFLGSLTQKLRTAGDGLGRRR